MERERLKRSEEEEDTLSCSTKKCKESHQTTGDRNENHMARMGSYRDKLVGSIPGAFEKAFGFDSAMQEDVESDQEDENALDDNIKVCFSREEKTRMRAPWYQTLIIKPFGRKIAYSFLVSKLRSMCNLKGGMDCIDLGFDFSFIKFEFREDVDNILKGGPWFIRQNFLAIRQWEPKFKASTTNFSSVAMWVRFPELPIEFYEHNALLKIGTAIGPVLRIDAYTANGARGCFARMCIQVNLDKSLVRSIFLGKLKQIIQYEGVESLCFECGRIGHKKEACPFTIHEPTSDVQVEQSMEATPKEVEKPVEKSHDDFGKWMIVTRHKPLSKARDKPSKVSLSQSDESSQSLYDKTSPRAMELEKVAGKRKAPQFQLAMTPREEGRSNKSHQDKSTNGKSSKRSGTRANQN